MWSRLALVFVAATVLVTPGARAAAPVEGVYWHGGALSSRPEIELEVVGARGSLNDLAKVRCAQRHALLPEGTFAIRNGRFTVAMPIATPESVATQSGRLDLTGRWTSPTSVSGRLRVVFRQRDGRRITCDSGRVAWRAGLASVVVRTAVSPAFAVPGTSTTTVTVTNDGDYASSDTRVSLVPDISVGVDEGLELPVRPPPHVSTPQGTCTWPARVAWGSDVHRGAVLCRLGRVGPHAKVTLTVTQTWPAESCVYDEDGNGQTIFVAWDPAVLSPLNGAGWTVGDHHSTWGTCPDRPGE